MSIDPAVHAALVVLFTWLVRLALSALGLDLGGEIATQLAQIIVAYILSLLGLGLYQRAVASNKLLSGSTYKPPFVS